MTAERYAAVDLGANGGRVIAVDFDGEQLALREFHRFPNAPLQLPDGLHWDVRRLFNEILSGLGTLSADRRPLSVGVDTWGVDYALLDRAGDLLGLPFCYRDPRTDGLMAVAFARVPREEIFARTGIQFLPFNSLYQLMASLRDGSQPLSEAACFLTLPDLFNHWLTGARVSELTAASTTQCLDPVSRTWAADLLGALGLPTAMFPAVIEPGTRLGTVLPAVAAEHGLGALTVVAPACHDTASAVAGTPLRDPGAAYLSCGTWSLVGVEVERPVTTPAALRGNFTNEGGVGGTYRLLRNVMGLWLLEESRRAWQRSGRIPDDASYDSLLAAAAVAPPFACVFDPDDPRFLPPGDMPARIRAAAAERGQRLPDEPGAIARAILESLALRYRWVLLRLEELTGRTVTVVHLVGGGSRNALLCQLTADVCGRTVLAGPVEATSIGNALVQALAARRIGTLAEGRELVRRSFPLRSFEPRSGPEHAEAYGRFTAIVEGGAPAG